METRTTQTFFSEQKDFLRSFNTNLSPDVICQLDVFSQFLQSYNKKINLISYKSQEDLFWNHFVDSLTLLKDNFLKGDSLKKGIDIGTGGGFPGIPLLLACPSLSMVLLDSVKKKQKFIQDFLDSEKLKQHQALWGRAEELAKENKYREKFDFALCRALGPFSTTLELSLPFVKVGGYWFSLRGEQGKSEAQSSDSFIRRLGGEIDKIDFYQLPYKDKNRCIIRVLKKNSTPSQYPRRVGIPAKRPL